jgi:ferredoxin
MCSRSGATASGPSRRKPPTSGAGSSSTAATPDRLADAVIEAAEECPGEAIYLEL